MVKQVKIGIIGTGSMGGSHVNSVYELPDTCLTAICDIDSAKFDKFRPEIRENVEKFTSSKDFFDKADVDAVIIATPHYDHVPLAIEALRHGKHILVEKPVAVEKKAAIELLTEAEKYPELVKCLMLCQRTLPAHVKIKKLIDSGELGELKRSTWIITNWYRPQAYYDSGEWRATWAGEGGGVLLNQCPHNLDLWQWLCGMPTKVYAKMKFGKYHDIEVEDDVVATVEFENGAMGSFITSTADTPGTNRLEIVFDGGSLICEKGSLTYIKLSCKESDFSKQNTGTYSSPACRYINVETDGQNLQHIGVLNAFAASILRDEPLVADGREGLNGLLLSNAMHLSAWTGKEIEMPLDEQLFKDLLDEKVKFSRRKENAKYVFSEFDKNHGNLCFV